MVQRQRTSKQRLQMKWQYPVFVSEEEKALEQSKAETVARMVQTSLPKEQALKFVKGGDLRPLLVLRECNWCNGTDNALLSQSGSNEKTLLMSQWFHCIKMPVHVLEENHPFRNLFAGENAPHLFVMSYDGAMAIPLKGDQSRTELWDAMETVLRSEYAGDPDFAIREITKILAEYDHIDSMEEWREQQIDEVIEQDGPDSKKIPKLRKELEKLAQQKAKAMEREQQLWNLGLKRKAADAEPLGAAGR